MKKINKNYIFFSLIYLAIFLQYPLGLTIGSLVFNVDIAQIIKPEFLLIWGAFRLFVILPLIFTLLYNLQEDHRSIYLQFGDKQKMFRITFWGTLWFTFLGSILYPIFLNHTRLNIINLLYLMPLFLLYALSNAFVEEVYFRGISMTMFTKNHTFWEANIAQSFLFALIHLVNPMSSQLFFFVILTFALGLIWGWITFRTKSLIPAIFLHMVADIFVAISLF